MAQSEMDPSEKAPSEASRRRRVFSGIQPSGYMHLGNYLGAVRRWARHQDDKECLYCIVDLHAITVPQEPEALRQQTRSAAALLLAAGIDPARSTLFVQSHVRAHAECCWLFTCLTPLGWLERMTQFKTKARQQQSVQAGLLIYPVLMAADILLYDADDVPVGDDQRQHLELTRDLAQRFNHRYKKTFRLPEPYILKATAKITDLQEPEAKMSKSASSPSGIVEMLDDPRVSAKKIRSAVTDSDTEIRFDPEAKPGVSNLLTIYSALSGRTVAALEESYAGRGYGDLKKDLAEQVVEFVTPFRDRTLALLDDRAELARILDDGARRAGEVAEATLRDVYDRVGFATGPAR